MRRPRSPTVCTRRFLTNWTRSSPRRWSARSWAQSGARWRYCSETKMIRMSWASDGLVGIVSERDVVRKLHELGADILRCPVSEIMTTLVATCTPTDSVDSLTALMTERRVRHVPVMENGRLAGIVSIGDVVKTRMEELEAQQEQLQAYITQGR